VENIIIYHGSKDIIKIPEYGKGKPYNDYGLGFYCTKILDLAKEWACTDENDGYVNKYILNCEDLKILNLTDKKYSILNWLTILLKNRTFIINNPIAKNAKEYLLKYFAIDVSNYDIIIGYRADDSYFSFAQDFLDNIITIRQLTKAMKLGDLGQQIVLISKKAFNNITFIESEKVDRTIYYPLRKIRDELARYEYFNNRENQTIEKDDLFIADIIRKDIKKNDKCL